MSAETVIQNLEYIGTNPNIRSGRPHIIGTTIEVSALAIQHIIHQQSVDEIAQDYRLTVSQVYAALAYYYAHKEEIDAAIKAQEDFAERLKNQQVAGRA